MLLPKLADVVLEIPNDAGLGIWRAQAESKEREHH
jgi:hypothetical protein